MSPRGREGSGNVDFPDVPEVNSAIFVSLDVPVTVEVDREREGGTLVTHDVLDRTTRRRHCGVSYNSA